MMICKTHNDKDKVFVTFGCRQFVYNFTSWYHMTAEKTLLYIAHTFTIHTCELIDFSKKQALIFSFSSLKWLCNDKKKTSEAFESENTIICFASLFVSDKATKEYNNVGWELWQ